ncbi:MAG: hypothetical protein KDB61_14700 [Planctomycetes bacterium]|nr:hypothetical protein [Planctomycetota bacterium]
MRVLALAWGFLEATLFFIVPDVLLSLVGLKRPQHAFALSFLVLLGALAGGALMYGWSVHDSAQALAWVERVPAIGPGLLDGVAVDLERQGPVATVWGAWRGVPYKAFAVQAPVVGVGPAGFLLVSIPARLLRFWAIIGLARLVGGCLPSAWTRAGRLRFVLGIWAVFYAWYFWVMPW